MGETVESSTAARSVADRMADAAEALIASLDSDQRAEASWLQWPESAESEDERRRWFYTPTDHGGLTVVDMAPRQYRRTMALLRTGLSEAAYNTAATIIGLENVLDQVEGFAGYTFARERGRDPGQYSLRIFGSPSSGTWGWRFGGHHISVNNLVVDGMLVATTPCFFGADPASAPLLGGSELRVLGAVEDIARALLRSLDRDQLDRAALTPRAPVDIVGGNRSFVAPGDRVVPLSELFRDDGDDPELHELMLAAHRAGEAHYGITEADHAAVELTEQPRGVPGRELDSGQRELISALLCCYTRRAPEDLAAEDRYTDAGQLDQVHLAWAGGLEPGDAFYYRLEGPRLLVEYDNAQRLANHAHSVWRDPDGDFGTDVLARHRRAHRH
jgi:hypothetical protein